MWLFKQSASGLARIRKFRDPAIDVPQKNGGLGFFLFEQFNGGQCDSQLVLQASVTGVEAGVLALFAGQDVPCDADRQGAM